MDVGPVDSCPHTAQLQSVCTALDPFSVPNTRPILLSCFLSHAERRSKKSSRAAGPRFLVSQERPLCGEHGMVSGFGGQSCCGRKGSKSTQGVYLPYVNLSDLFDMDYLFAG